ncbi:MAG: M23 family metallopeptidase [Spirochaetes bacterium]|nr:M23 family metallopeptidase [Spirochaetota bacterium]
MKYSGVPLFIVALLLGLPAAPGLAADYPQMRVLTRDDLLFVQHQAELEEYYRLSQAVGEPELPMVSLFSYQKRKGEDIFSLNARLGLPYDTLATLNGAAEARSFNGLDRILVPTQPGIYVHVPPRTAFEDMLLSSRLAAGRKPRSLVIARAGRKETVSFFPGEMFNSVERAYFLGILFQFPIAFTPARGFIAAPEAPFLAAPQAPFLAAPQAPLITSRYGMRADPFSGHPEFHNGLDIGAVEGTAVRAAREGTVSESGSSEILGKYLVLSHPGGWETVYGHLSSIRVTVGREVGAGQEIGAVGRTGRATGSHLHFEVRKKGSTTDPFPLLAIARGKR